VDPFAPFRLGSLELPNRLLMAPVKTGYGSLTSGVTFRHEAYYHRWAEGRVGAIIVEPLFIDALGKDHPKQLGISNYDHVNELKGLVKAIHSGGILAIAHINHAGRAANPKVIGQKPVVPSEVACLSTGATPEAMTKQLIEMKTIGDAGRPRQIYDAVREGFETAVNI